MREAHFQTEIVKSFKAEGHWAYKIPDAPTRKLMGQLRFAAEKPFDLIACVRRQALAVECKQMKSFEAFGLRAMQESQVEAFDLLTKLGNAHCYVMLNVRLTGINRLYAFRWRNLRHLWETQGSIKAAILRELKYTEGHGGLFPLAPWLRAEGILHDGV